MNDFTQATWCEEPGATAHFCNRQWNYGAIHAVEAWQAGKTGSSAVKVAILDSGIDWTYPDLTPLVDLGHSAAFVSDQAVMATFFPGTPWNAQTAVLDLAGHGTHVASTVASRSQIVAGVTKNTTLWAVKVLDATGSGPFSAIVGGYLYAIQNGADVINLSLGATLNRRDFSARGGNGPSAIAFFNRLTSVAKQANVLVVAAAGNSATNLQADKNAYDLFCSSTHVICVGATGPTAQFPVVLPTTSDAAQQLDVWNHWTPDVDAPSIFSNFGRGSIDVAAPGGNYTLTADGALVTVSFVWQACSHFLLNYDPETKVFTTSNCSRNPNTNRTVGYVGTSMASPHVAGLAALLEAEGITDPTRLRATITQTADRIGGRSGSTPSYGAGRINVARALGLPVTEW